MSDIETLNRISDLQRQIAELAAVLEDHKTLLDGHSEIYNTHENNIRGTGLAHAFFFNLFARSIDETMRQSFANTLENVAQSVENNKGHNKFYLDELKAMVQTLRNPDSQAMTIN